MALTDIVQPANPAKVIAPAFLARIALPAVAWTGPLAQAIGRLLANPPANARVFRRCLVYSSLYGRRLAEAASNTPVDVRGLVVDYPLACTLLKLRPGQPLGQTLGWLLLELHLERVHLVEAKALAANLRGYTDGADDHSLRLTLGDVNGLPHLLLKMQHLEARSGRKDEITGHADFDRNWRARLRATCLNLVRSVETSDRSPDPDLVESAPLDDPGATLPAPYAPADCEEPAGLSFFSFEPDGVVANPAGGYIQRPFKWAQLLLRRSAAELQRHCDSVLPTALVRCERAYQLEAVSKALDRGEVVQANKHLLHLLAIETGLTDHEARVAAISHDTSSGITVLDLRNRCLRRVELRPPNAFCPEKANDCWLPTGGDLIFPVSSETARVAARLQRLRNKAGRAEAGGDVMTRSLVCVELESSDFPVRDAIRVTRSCRAVTGGAYRLRLATIVAERLGSDAAQIAFGDSFGISAAPTYYSAFSATQIARCVTSQWASLGWSEAAHERALRSGDHLVGSKARPSSLPYAEAWSMLAVPAKRPRGRPSTKGAESSWAKLRDALAIRLLLATGVRPTKALALLRIDDFITTAALVVLQDKASDPAHATRLACTGFGFLHALQGYLAELQRWARNIDNAAARSLARKILAGEAPLFDVPGADGHIERLEISALLQRMPPPWRDKANLHRHTLCQALIRARIDPELRYFQMGWIVAGAHAMSDECPRSPMELGLELAPTIDAWMAEIGWGMEREDHCVIPLPLRSQDWTSVTRGHAAAADAKRKELRTALRERRRAERPEVLKKLAARMRETIPYLEVQETRHGIRLIAPGTLRGSTPLTVGPAVVAKLLEPFSDPMHQYIVRAELARTLAAANRDQLCRAVLPRVPSVALSMVASPIVLGVGGAVEDCNRLRRALVDRISRLEAEVPMHDLRVMLVWAIACHSPYRRLDDAVAIAQNASQAIQSNAERWIVRVPMRGGHVVLSGPPALLLLRVFNAADQEQLSVELGEAGALLKALGVVPDSMVNASDLKVAKWMEAALLLAGEIELPGPARMVMRCEALPATVTAERAASAADGASVPSATVGARKPEDEGEDDESIQVIPIPNPSHRPTRDIRDVMALLSREDPSGSDGSRPGRKTRMREIRDALAERIKASGSSVTISSIFLRYTQSRLFPEAGGRGIEPSTMAKIYSRLSPLFGTFDGTCEVSELSSAELTGALFAALWRVRRKDKADVYSELERFLRYAKGAGMIAEPEWSILRREAGLPYVAVDPGIVSDVEARRVLNQLISNLDTNPDSMLDPRERRFREVQLIAYVIGEGVGARPRSIYGLALADLCFEPDGEWIHLHSYGRFASIKTPASAGFIRAMGESWDACKSWVRQWKQEALECFPGVDAEDIPLFQVQGEPLGTRYPQSEVFGRIGELLRWSTQQEEGRSYWIRKRCLQHRHSRWRQDPESRTRDVLRAMKDSGHVSIATSVVSYLADPLCFMDPLQGVARMTSREAAVMSGLSMNVVEQRWKRARLSNSTVSPKPYTWMSSLLRFNPPRWVGATVGDPPVYRPHTTDFGVSAIQEILNLAAGKHSADAIAQATGASAFSVAQVLRAATSLELRTGFVFGTGPGELHRPRATGIARTVASLLDRRDGRLRTVAREWVALARVRPVDHGCVLFDRQAISAFFAITRDVGLQIEVEESLDGYSCLRLKRRAYGVWPCLRWVLAVVWIDGEVADSG